MKRSAASAVKKVENKKPKKKNESFAARRKCKFKKNVIKKSFFLFILTKNIYLSLSLYIWEEVKALVWKMVGDFYVLLLRNVGNDVGPESLVVLQHSATGT